MELTFEEDPPEHLHFFLAGSAQVTVCGRKVGMVGPTSLVGEAAFLTGETASATVTVLRPSRVFSIEVARLREHLERHPSVRQVLEARIGANLGQKLRSTNTAMAAIRD